MLKYQCCWVKKINQTCTYYSEIEKPEKYIVFNSLNECDLGPTWVLRCFYLTILQLTWMSKTTAEHDDES